MSNLPSRADLLAGHFSLNGASFTHVTSQGSVTPPADWGLNGAPVLFAPGVITPPTPGGGSALLIVNT